MDDFLRLAYERRERLRRELLAIDNLIAEHERLESTTQKPDRLNYELPLDSPKRGRAGSQTKSKPDEMFDAAERVILSEGRPLSRGELIVRLEREGFAFPGTDKVKVFGTNLWRSRRFISLKGLGYWPEAHPLPAQYQSAEHRQSMLKSHN